MEIGELPASRMVSLVKPEGFDAEAEITVEQGEDSDWLRVKLEDSPVGANFRVEVIGRNSCLLDAGQLVCHRGESNETSLYIPRWGLGWGRHTVRVMLIPDPEAVIGCGATIDEILGATIKREVTVYTIH